MGIYIKNEIMPVGCYECKARRDVNIGVGIADGCMLLKQLISNVIERHPDCPMVEVPPHGRLIDADGLEVISYTGTEGRPDTFDAGVNWLAEQIDKLPTVIPEEG